MKGWGASSYPFLSMPTWQVVQRSTLGVGVKITSSVRLAGMIWLIFREGLARSRMGRLRTNQTKPRWMVLSFSSRRVFSAKSSFCVFSASIFVFSRAATRALASSRRRSTSSSFRRRSCHFFSSPSSFDLFFAAPPAPWCAASS